MNRAIEGLESINRHIGHALAWLALLMVLMTFYNVISRYWFETGYPWQQELVRFFHAILFLLAAGYTLLSEEQVRVDVYYQRYSVQQKAWCNLLGTVFLLFPVCISIVYFSWEYIQHSWALYESSNEYKGMPGIFLLKSCIWGFAALLSLQGIAIILKSIQTLRCGPDVG